MEEYEIEVIPELSSISFQKCLETLPLESITFNVRKNYK